MTLNNFKPLLKTVLYIILPVGAILSVTELDQVDTVQNTWIFICGLLGWFSSNIFPNKEDKF